MNREDIIRMAREALEECDGKDYYDYIGDKIHWWGEAEAIIKFANLVAAAEREACAVIAHNTYEGFGVDAQGVDFVKQQVIRQIKERGQV